MATSKRRLGFVIVASDLSDPIFMTIHFQRYTHWISFKLEIPETVGRPWIWQVRLRRF